MAYGESTSNFSYKSASKHIITHILPTSTRLGIVVAVPRNSLTEKNFSEEAAQKTIRGIESELHEICPPDTLAKMIENEGDENRKENLSTWLRHLPNGRPEMLYIPYLLDESLMKKVDGNRIIAYAIAMNFPDTRDRSSEYRGIFLPDDKMIGLLKGNNGTEFIPSNGSDLRRVNSYIESTYGETLTTGGINIGVHYYAKKKGSDEMQIVSESVPYGIVIKPKISNLEITLINGRPQKLA